MPMCWIDDTRLVMSGHGDGGPTLEHAVDIYDARTGALESWIAGPDAGSNLVFDRVLFALGHSIEVYDVERRARLIVESGQAADSSYHRRAKHFATRPRDGRITLSRLCGLDAGAAWASERVRAVAASIDDPETQLGILGDALDDAGCTDDELIAHCRNPGPHGRHCWALDRLARR
ncbi:MAG TPA: hypothetical protein VGG28_06120, partial [Kofleriaceae bacterium]|jgi:hypothetical protein